MYTVFFLPNLSRFFIRSVHLTPAKVRLASCRLLSTMEDCVLECLQRLHEPIPLPDNVPVRIGRSPETQITEARCSRLQVEIQVSWATGEIKVTQLGANTSTVDGRDLQRGKTVIMSPESTLFILKGYFPHKVVFKRKSQPPEAPAEEKKKSLDCAKAGMKRSADTSNGVREDSIPPKKKKVSKNIEDKELESEEDSKEKSRHKKEVLKLNKKHSNDETVSGSKVTDFFEHSKTVTSKDKKDSVFDRKSKDHDDSRNSSREKEKDYPTGKGERGSQNKKDKMKADKKNPSKTEGRSSSEASGRGTKSKRPLQDLSDEESEEHIKVISEKLQQLKQKAKAERESAGHNAGASVAPKPAAESGEKRKSSTDSTGKSKTCKTGKPATESTWDSLDNKLCIFTSKGVAASERIAGFDIDGTIITTQSRRVFPKDTSDWKILMPEVFGKLKHLIAAGYKIVFFTNQLGVGRGKIKIQDLQDKFDKVVARLQVPVQIFISTTGGSYRKPATGMWQILKKQRNDGIPISVADSFYVGDAAGRQENWAPKKKKDFSCSDRLFALNIGLKFHTPEEFFLGHKPAPFKLPDFDPRALSTDAPLLEGGESVTSDTQEVVVLVGFQACGKSTFAKTHLVPRGYVYINQDTLKTWQKCVNECSKALAAGKSVVIDNTNVDPESRARYIDCARKAHKPCRCFFFDFPIQHCRHNERFREITNRDHKPINEQVFNSTKSRFKPPEMKEGFSKIIKVNFVPHFTEKLHEKIYRQFLLEK